MDLLLNPPAHEIQWESDDCAAFLNAAFSTQQKAQYLQSVHEAVFGPCFSVNLKGHLFVLTSGTSGALKWVCVSKEAFLASASAVNQVLGSGGQETRLDTWIHCLPDYHVGGLAIWARSHLSGARVRKIPDNQKWNPHFFVKEVAQHHGTLASLVPTQVYDLVQLRILAPKCLRVVLVGGGALNESVYLKAKALGWPLTPTYGMSELGSQVATASLASSSLYLLPHIGARVDPTTELLQIRSPALFSGYLHLASGSWEDPKQEGWFTTSDRAELKQRELIFRGRRSDWVKVGAEKVSMSQLRLVWEQIRMEWQCRGDSALFPTPDDRLGTVIELQFDEVSAIRDPLNACIEAFNARVLPFERIRSSRKVTQIPRTALGKIKETWRLNHVDNLEENSHTG